MADERDQQSVYNRNMSNYSFGTYHDVGACRNVSERSSAGKGRFANAIPLRIDTYSSRIRTEPGRTMTQTVAAGTVSRSTFSRSGTYTLRCNLNPLAVDADTLSKRKCIYEKISTHPGTTKSVVLQSRFSVPEEHPEVGERSDSINSMMW
jgi:hypothetical protein